MRIPGRRRLIAVAVVTSLVMAAGAAAWWQWDGGRQPRVDDAVTTMTTAVTDAVVAAGDNAAVTVSAVVAAAECELGFLRRGRVFTAKADLYTDPGAEESLITTIEQGLTGRYATRRAEAVAGIRALQADVGSVRLSVRRLSPGWLAVTARSGCSAGSVDTGTADAGSPGVAGVTSLLATVGTRPATLTEQRLNCPNGAIVTVSAVSEPIDAGRLATRLATTVPAGARRFAADDANRVAYRDGPTSVVVAASDDGTAVTVQHTTDC
ncbi:hypothetical protein Q0Z83_033450 [Actinoplanes sichuanensis]|uniref:Uncharacterized protein n=1 Tax=Actinoplanes sichuanensis TaxID=512349 RepID=A0ABW4A5N2_9ACTN|nr:hypothetical protein [Actinoplanes sichuanensis]BEL05154.1 hypothetical protein Q0Z83_033450 [Actinoplanes sichuanensis]